MAMTKKERAEFQAAIDRADTLAALRWTAPVPKDVKPPQRSSEYVAGWVFNTYSQVVEEAWTTGGSHGSGPIPTVEQRRYSTGSQHSRAMYSTKLLALRALRHSVECKAASDLMKIDRQIAEAEKAQQAQQGEGKGA